MDISGGILLLRMILMDLKLPLPPGRTYEQIKNHYEVEKNIAARLMSASREERKAIYSGMYNELFTKVPDHSRLSRREDESETHRVNRTKFALVRGDLDKATVFAEFAPGDCRFIMEVAPLVKQAIGIDISDQRNPSDTIPKNFTLIVYDGYDLSKIPDGTIDILFSDQLVEHFHPEDTELHFQIAHRILKKGGKYIFRTPHAFSGPHDISKYFSDTPEGFHLKEWTYGEIRPVLLRAGFGSVISKMYRKRTLFWLPFGYFILCELVLGRFSHQKITGIAEKLIHEIIIVAIKQ
jgi:SAM-dependent methyltransferase